MPENKMTAEELQDRIRQAPFHQWLDLNVTEVTEEDITVSIGWREEFVVNAERGYTHGGILATVIDVAADYDTDVTDLLSGFFLGEWVDELTQEGQMTAFMYQGVRLKAWRDGQNYQHFPRSVVDLEVRTAWGLAELALAKLDAVGAL